MVWSRNCLLLFYSQDYNFQPTSSTLRLLFLLLGMSCLIDSDGGTVGQTAKGGLTLTAGTGKETSYCPSPTIFLMLMNQYRSMLNIILKSTKTSNISKCTSGWGSGIRCPTSGWIMVDITARLCLWKVKRELTKRASSSPVSHESVPVMGKMTTAPLFHEIV